MNDIIFVGRHPLMRSVSRHAHESWEFIYCTYGAGTLELDDGRIPYKVGDVLIIPPMVPHANLSETGFKNLHINMNQPALSVKRATLISDDGNHFLLDAFTAAFFHFHSDRVERNALLSAYGNLISCYLSSYQTAHSCPDIVRDIERAIIHSYPDCDFELGAYLRSLPFSEDYLRKLFHQEFGVTPHKYLIDKRLHAAAELLANSAYSNSSIASIAATCGFREPLYFSKMFKKKFGVAPSFYLNANRAEPSAPASSDSLKLSL